NSDFFLSFNNAIFTLSQFISQLLLFSQNTKFISHNFCFFSPNSQLQMKRARKHQRNEEQRLNSAEPEDHSLSLLSNPEVMTLLSLDDHRLNLNHVRLRGLTQVDVSVPAVHSAARCQTSFPIKPLPPRL
uniref:Uncharacterized protein n=1 Tax=Cyprinus carpio TaxID=7962 RepID=A0A8C2J1S5_CYPCA